jgi:hypothetical protein
LWLLIFIGFLTKGQTDETTIQANMRLRQKYSTRSLFILCIAWPLYLSVETKENTVWGEVLVYVAWTLYALSLVPLALSFICYAFDFVVWVVVTITGPEVNLGGQKGIFLDDTSADNQLFQESAHDRQTGADLCSWECACGEKHEVQFISCWKCGKTTPTREGSMIAWNWEQRDCSKPHEFFSFRMARTLYFCRACCKS